MGYTITIGKGGKTLEQTLYGIYSTVSKRFVFGIQEPSKTKARKALFKEIGTDSYKWRFEVRKIPKSGLPTRAEREEQQNQRRQEKKKKRLSTKDLLNLTAQRVIELLKAQGVTIQRYDSYSTNSIYLKFDYGVLNSLRISDHPGKKHLAYRYNLAQNIQQPYQDKHSGYDRFYASLDDIEMMVNKILFDRRTKLLNYGWENYVTYMENNINDNKDAKGFWAQAKIV